MKKIILFLIVVIFTAPFLKAQDDNMTNKKIEQPINQKNLVKLNLLALGVKNITVQYERVIGKKSTVALSIRVMPKSGLPFKSSFRDAINDPNTKTQVDN